MHISEILRVCREYARGVPEEEEWDFSFPFSRVDDGNGDISSLRFMMRGEASGSPVYSIGV